MTVDVIAVLLRAIDVLKTAGNLELEDDPTENEEALEQISNYVDNIDTANGLCDFVFWFIIIRKSRIFSLDFDSVFGLYIMWMWAVFLMFSSYRLSILVLHHRTQLITSC
jgi:hypothetical protein